MDLRVFTEPQQGATYDDLLAVARRAEELGIGAGWYEQEHRAYGIPFPPTGERFDRLEEALAVVTGLWEAPSGETFSFDGRHYPVQGSPALPKPVQSPRPPVIVGGKGKVRTRRWRPGSPTSSTSRSSRRSSAPPSSTGCAPPARRPAATRRRCCSPTRWCCAALDHLDLVAERVMPQL